MQKQVWKTLNLSAVKSFAQDTWWKWRRYRLALLNALDFFFLIRGLQLALVTPFSTISGLWHFDTCICRPAVLGFFTIWWIFGCSCFQWGVQLPALLWTFYKRTVLYISASCTVVFDLFFLSSYCFFWLVLYPSCFITATTADQEVDNAGWTSCKIYLMSKCFC